MPERPFRVRTVDHRHEQRIRRLVRQRERIVAPAVPVIFGDARSEICLERRALVFVTLEHGIALGEHVGHRVDDAGRIAAVDHLQPRIAVCAASDVDEAARSDQR